MPYTPSARIRRIEAAARRRFAEAPAHQTYATMTKAFFERYQDADLRERQARTYADALVREPVHIQPEERIHGIFHRNMRLPLTEYSPNPEWGEYNPQLRVQQRLQDELPEFLPYIADEGQTFIINDDGTPGHIAWRWDWVLRDGLDAIIARHRDASEASDDPEARAYYQGVVICLQAILDWNQQHVEAIEEMITSGDCNAEQEASMRECADVMRRVPAQPARTFHEALQAYHFMWICAFYDGPYGGNSPGRFDYLLWPFLREEYESGSVSAEQATELVAEVFIKCDEVVHSQDGSVLTIVTGGLDRELKDAVNPLSCMVIDAIEALDITHPAVYNRISEKNPEAYRQRCLQYMLSGRNRAQFLSEEAILRAMMRDGYMPAADAAMYICGGCMELNPQGLTADLFWSFRYNICKTLELCITGGIDLVDGSERLAMPLALTDVDNFDAFYEYLESEIEKLLLLKFRALDITAEELGKLRPQFVISSMVEDCFERGRNQMHGGARYADYGGSIIGIPNVANSLMAIKRAVFDDGFVTASELIAALQANFAGHEALRQRLLQLPRYGEQDAETDGIMNRLIHSISRVLDSYTTRHGGTCKQVLLTFSFAPAFGAALGATAEGNLAGTPVAHGLTPFKPKDGLSAAMQSYLSLDNELVSGGASTMWDMDAEWISASILDSVYKVFEQGGGQIFQGNMTDVAALEEAFDKPEAHPELIVRVGGFSARFMNLSREVQQDIIQRRRWK